MDLISFIWTANPTKIRIGERQRGEDEPKLLDTTVGRTVPLLSVTPARTESKLDASVDRLFDEGVAVIRRRKMTPLLAVKVLPKHKKKRKTVVDAGEPSHPTKKLRNDHGTPGGPTVGGKSRSAVQRLFAGAALNAKVRGEVIPTLPFVTSSVSVTPEHEEFLISSDSSHHSGANITGAEVDSFARTSVPLMTMTTTVTSTADPATTAKENLVKSSIVSGFSVLTGSDFIVGGIRTVVSPDTDLQKVYVPQWSVTNGSRLDDGRTCREMVDEFAPPKFFALIHGMEHDQLFTEFNVGVARQMSLSAEARDEEIKSLKAQLLVKKAKAAEAVHLRAEASKFEVVEKSLQDEIKSFKERNTTLEKEKGVLDVRVVDLAAMVKVREQEAADSDAMVTNVKLQNDRLADQVRELETSSAKLQEKVAAYENCMSQLEKFQDEQMAVVHEKFNKLDADFIETCLHLEERLYPHLLTTIAGRRWLLTYGMKLVVFKCLNSPEYLSALGAAISKAVKKGMQDGLVARITHGQEGRVLTDVAAFNPSAEDDFTSTLQEVQNVNFSLLAELESNKDASVKTVMDLLRLDEALMERLGLNESQPHVDQLMVP
ncbi:hypothetical protein Tco_1455134, partial [Tanacetum coccineum]